MYGFLLHIIPGCHSITGKDIASRKRMAFFIVTKQIVLLLGADTITKTYMWAA